MNHVFFLFVFFFFYFAAPVLFPLLLLLVFFLLVFFFFFFSSFFCSCSSSTSSFSSLLSSPPPLPPPHPRYQTCIRVPACLSLQLPPLIQACPSTSLPFPRKTVERGTRCANCPLSRFLLFTPASPQSLRNAKWQPLESGNRKGMTCYLHNELHSNKPVDERQLEIKE